MLMVILKSGGTAPTMLKTLNTLANQSVEMDTTPLQLVPPILYSTLREATILLELMLLELVTSVMTTTIGILMAVMAIVKQILITLCVITLLSLISTPSASKCLVMEIISISLMLVMMETIFPLMGVPPVWSTTVSNVIEEIQFQQSKILLKLMSARRSVEMDMTSAIMSVTMETITPGTAAQSSASSRTAGTALEELHSSQMSVMSSVAMEGTSARMSVMTGT